MTRPRFDRTASFAWLLVALLLAAEVYAIAEVAWPCIR